MECNQLETLLLDTAKSVLGQTTGKSVYNEQKAWWWNKEVLKAVKENRLEFRQYQQARCDEDKEFGEANKRANRVHTGSSMTSRFDRKAENNLQTI